VTFRHSSHVTDEAEYMHVRASTHAHMYTCKTTFTLTDINIKVCQLL